VISLNGTPSTLSSVAKACLRSWKRSWSGTPSRARTVGFQTRLRKFATLSAAPAGVVNSSPHGAGRDLSGADHVYLWVDGIRLGEGKLCLLVMIGVRADGRKELVTLAGGYRESAGSWADLLRDCTWRGMRARYWRSATAR
jgi:hypothetical protein